MDPFEMLIRASAIDESNNNNINNSYHNNNTISFDYRNYLQDPMLGIIMIVIIIIAITNTIIIMIIINIYGVSATI